MTCIFGANECLFDVWTLVHFASGLLIAWLVPALKLPPVWTVGLVIIAFLVWEAIELANHPDGFGGQETGVNMFVDLVADFAGLGLGLILMRFPRR